MRMVRGNSSAAVVAIVALVILAGAAWFVFFAGSGDGGHDTDVHIDNRHDEPDDDGDHLEIHVFPDDDQPDDDQPDEERR